MDTNNLANLHSERNEPEYRSFTMWLAAFSFMLGFLLTLLGWKYQNSSVSLFHTHGAIMLLLIIDVCIFTIALAMTILPTANRTHLSLFKNVCLISGAFACNLLLLILVPLFGWFIFIIFLFILVWLLYGSYNQILQCCQKILEPMWHSISRHSTIYVTGSEIFSNQFGKLIPKHSVNLPPTCRIKKCDWKIMSNSSFTLISPLLHIINGGRSQSSYLVHSVIPSSHVKVSCISRFCIWGSPLCERKKSTLDL